MPDDPPQNAPRGPLLILRQEWRDVFRSVWKEVKGDNLSLVAAGVGFYSLLAIFPAIGAIVALYGLAVEPQTVQEHLGFLRSVLPRDAYQLLADQVRELTSHEDVKLGFGFVAGLALSMWSASRAIIAMITAMNIAYEEDEERNFFVLNLIALAFTIAAIAVLLGLMAVIGGFPAAVEALNLSEWMKRSLLLLRWPPIAVVVLAGLALIYRYAPSRPNARIEWLTPGAVLAMIFWLITSAGFSLYAANFGKYDETFGSLGAGIILLLWFYLSAFAVCVGAEINAELEFRARGKASGRTSVVPTPK